MSLPVQSTPKKKFKGQFEDFNDEEETLELFELSPEKYWSEKETDNSDVVIE